MQPGKHPRATGTPPPREHPQIVLSRDLFRDGPVVRIVHGDQVYLLRRTRENRLILTK